MLFFLQRYYGSLNHSESGLDKALKYVGVLTDRLGSEFVDSFVENIIEENSK